MPNDDDSPTADARPVKKVRKPIAVDDDRDIDDKPVRPKKKKRKKQSMGHLENDRSDQDNLWWVVPVVLIVIGLIMSLVGSVGFVAKANSSKQQIGTVIVIVITFVQFLISVPLSVAALFVGGKILGIEYGTPMQAILGIAAIGSMMMGLDWMLSWFGLWSLAVMMITFIAGFSLFMTLFKLDTWEVWASIICIKVLTTIAYFAVAVFILGALSSASRP